MRFGPTTNARIVEAKKIAFSPKKAATSNGRANIKTNAAQRGQRRDRQSVMPKTVTHKSKAKLLKLKSENAALRIFASA